MASGELSTVGPEIARTADQVSIPEPARRLVPSKLFVEVTTRCNLRCAMCVKQSLGQQLVEGSMSEEVFERLTPTFGRLETLILNGIGEPLMHGQLERFVARARELMPSSGWIGFQTNGQLLTDSRAEALVAAGLDRIAFSADAVVDVDLMALRDGATIGPIERAAASMHRAADQTGRTVSLGLEFVAMRENLDQLPGLIRWAERNRFDFVIVTHMLPYDPSMATHAVFSPSTDRALAIYRQWRDIALADGVDLRRYLGLPFIHQQFDNLSKSVPLRSAPTSTDAATTYYVAQMLQTATEQGITLKVKDLLAFNEERLTRVEEVFATARDLAAETGITLRLPATVPTQVRRCDFVEEGSAFVSWNGDLHPCYFLWHGFQCHLAGLAKTVNPVTFGNVTSVPILDAWNGKEWATFRHNVLRYDFPFCYDCNVALCDYVEGGDFEQDCYLTEVPCATCLWCTGPFQCLS